MDGTWNEDTIQADRRGDEAGAEVVPPERSASTGGVAGPRGTQPATRQGDPRSGGTSGTTTGDAPYDLDADGEDGRNAKTPSGT